MKSTFIILLATTAIVGALGLPALAALRASNDVTGMCGSDACAAVFRDGDQSAPLFRVSGDDDDDNDGGRERRKHDDDDDDDCEEDDDDGCMGAGARGNPAPAGTVAPPANGLFGNGAPPVAVTN